MAKTTNNKATVKANANKQATVKAVKGTPKATQYFSECKTAEDIKSKFVELEGSLKGKAKTAMLDQFNSKFNKLKSTHATRDGKLYEKATEETAEDFINLIISLSKVKGVKIEVCGSWLWVSGDTKPVKDELKELGFWFSAKKSAWYHNGGQAHKRSKNHTLEEIRQMWGSVAV